MFQLWGYCAAEKPLDYRLALAAECTPRECTSAGPLCESCTSLVACVEDGDTGNYTRNPIETCKGDTPLCIDGECTAGDDPFCTGLSEVSFVCNQIGVFPDPFYHNKYVFCYKDGSTFKSILNVCDDGFGFNIATDLCSEPVTNAECPYEPYPVPL